MPFKNFASAIALTASAALMAGCTTMEGSATGTASAMANDTVMVGGAEMLPTRNIVENASLSADHTTLVAAVKAAGLADILAGPGPVTIFAPTNDAFAALPAGTVEMLLKPENKSELVSVLLGHAVPGSVTSTDLVQLINAGGGSATVTTIGGGMLTATLVDGMVKLTDPKGRVATVTQADVMQSNGVIHVTDMVSLQK